MVAPIRLILALLVVLTIIYVVVSIWSRQVRRAKLEAWWDEKGHTGDKDAFIKRGLRQYDNSIRRKLILGVYVVPLVLIAVLVYVTNFM